MMYTHPHPWIGLRKMINFRLTFAVLGLAAPLFSQFLYVATSSNDVLGYTINTTTGALTPISGSPFPTGVFPRGLTVDPTGRFAYVASFGSNNVQGYSINRATGVLTPIPGSPFLAEMGPSTVAVSPRARFAYVANYLSTSISGYEIDQTTGVLTSIPGSPFTTNFTAEPNPFFVTVDPTGKFLYAAINPTTPPTVSGGILGYTINPDTGALKVIGFTPFPAGGAACCPVSIAIDPTGKYLYAPSGGTGGGGVFAYTINPSTGTLTSIPGSPFNAGFQTFSVALDPTGKFVYVVDLTGLFGFTINAINGALVPIAGSPFFLEADTSDVVVDPTGRFVYAGDEDSGVVLIYAIDAVSGALTSLPGLPLPTNDQPGPMAISPLPLLAVSVTPNSGSGASQTFAFHYSDSHGFGNLTNAYAGFGPTAYVEHSCRVEYYRGINKLYLKNDDGTAFLGPLTPGVPGTLSNSQCTLDAGKSSVSGSGDILTLNLAFSFKPAFAGMQGIFMYAIDRSGLTTPGRQKVGTWDVTP